MSVAERCPSMEQVALAAYEAWTTLEPELYRLGPRVDMPGLNDTPRHVLSCLVGTWQRIPIYGAYFLARYPVPLHDGDDYWMSEWSSAPVAAFVLALQAAYAGHQAFLRHLDPTLLAQVATTPNGEMSLGDFLLETYRRTHSLLAELTVALDR